MDTRNKKTQDIFTTSGEWVKQLAGLKKRFSQLTEADLKFEVGKEDELLARLQARLGKKRDEVIEVLKGGHFRTVTIVS